MTGYLIAIIVQGGIIGALGFYVDMFRKSRDHWLEQAAKFADQADDADARVAQALIDTTPLLVKTDWTTGNYIGRIDYLRSQESRRNAQVDRLRKVLMDSQVVKDEIAENGLPKIEIRGLS